MLNSLKHFLNERKEEELSDLITKHPEVLNQKDESGASGLLIIAYSGNHRALDLAKENKRSFTFHEAIVCGKVDDVKTYLNQDKTLSNSFSDDGFTPLSLAAFFNQQIIAQLLLDKGADPGLKSKNPMNVNALHSAVAKENKDLCRLFIEAGVDVNEPQMQNVTPLHSAAHRGNLNLVQLLVENGANIHIKMDNGDTAISIAKREGHIEIENYLHRSQNN